MKKCHDYHDNWILNNEENIQIIDGNVDTEESPDIIQKWMEDIVNFMGDMIDNEESPKILTKKYILNIIIFMILLNSMVPQIKQFNPDVIIAIGGGGFIPARI